MLNPKNAQWVVFPQPGTNYIGLQTNVEPEKALDSAMTGGQNAFVFDGDKLGTRPFGTTVFGGGSVAAGAFGYSIIYTFRLRNGVDLLIRVGNSEMDVFDPTSEAWANLQDSLQSEDYDFAHFNVNADAENRLYFGNGVDDFAYWNGIITNLTVALAGGEATINVTSTADFPSSGTIRIEGTDVTYSGTTATTFTGCAGTPAAANGTAVLAPVVTDGSAPKGNIYMAAQNRLFIVPSINPQLVMFSEYGDASSWSTNTVLEATATSAGAFNLIEGGGAVKAMVQDENAIFFLKETITYRATLSDSFYSLQTIKPFDGKSVQSGVLSKRGVFTGGNQVFVVTTDKRIKALERIEQIDFPQLTPISHIIQNTVDDYGVDMVQGICFGDYAWFALKKQASDTANNRVLAWNMVEQHWETPIVGWSPSSFTIYDDGTGPALLFSDANSPNIWKVTTSQVSDGPYVTSVVASTKRFDFALPSQQKELDDVYIEGYISLATDLTIRLLLDENGYSGVFETTLAGTETQYQFENSVLNPLGINPLGVEVLGANEDTTGLVKFRVHLSQNLRRVPFYNCQLQFESSGENQMWQILSYGFLVRTHSQPTRTSLIRAFS